MILNKYSESVLTTAEAIELVYSGGSLSGVILNDESKVTEFLNSEISNATVRANDESLSVEEYHGARINRWAMPVEYETYDIETYLHSLCVSSAEHSRVDEELILYTERGLLPMLRFMVYFVTTLREHNVLWGVGRGSSVSSFVLFLIGVHRINSLEYDLDISEFLKG